jgi:DNA mismatch repair protein MutS2
VFDCVFADIGDEQSIDQSLSTFSAHITNIAAILTHASRHSLVLLDELGSGTDPQEGSAIAMAILDYLIEKNARLLITTHHGILKNYGYTRKYVENASVEFNSSTLSPTYRIKTGIPGESHALDIAARNGLQPDIIAGARSYIDDGRSDISALISGLKEKHRELDMLEEKARLEDSRLKNERRQADLKELRLRQKETELKAGFAGKLRLLLDESRKTLENLVRELKEGDITRDKTLRVKEFLGELARNVEAENAALEEEERVIAKERASFEESDYTGNDTAVAMSFTPGMEVFAGNPRRRGTLIRLNKRNHTGDHAGNTWIVEIGSLRISFPEQELVPAPSLPPPKPLIASFDLAASPLVRSEINLCGMRLEEALETLRRQIEAAILNRLNIFSVVHGKGDGILQKGVHNLLKNDPAVADYYFSHPDLGGFGRTEVGLK